MQLRFAVSLATLILSGRIAFADQIPPAGVADFSLSAKNTADGIAVRVSVMNSSAQYLQVRGPSSACIGYRLVIFDGLSREVSPADAPCAPSVGSQDGVAVIPPGKSYFLREVSREEKSSPGYLPISAWGFTQTLADGTYTLEIVNNDYILTSLKPMVYVKRGLVDEFSAKIQILVKGGFLSQ